MGFSMLLGVVVFLCTRGSSGPVWSGLLPLASTELPPSSSWLSVHGTGWIAGFTSGVQAASQGRETLALPGPKHDIRSLYREVLTGNRGC